MPWAASLLLLAAGTAQPAGDPVVHEVELPMRLCEPAGQGARTCRFSIPADSISPYVRIVSSCAGPIAWNGHVVGREETGFPLSPVPAPSHENIVRLPQGCEDARLVKTPRLFLVTAKRTQTTRKLLVLIENALENTSSFALTGMDASGAVVAERLGTIPANQRMQMELPEDRPVTVLELWKAPEALEGSYRYRLTVSSRSSTDSGTRKP